MHECIALCSQDVAGSSGGGVVGDVDPPRGKVPKSRLAEIESRGVV
jgi:hypothetical protein